jgi:hypothetical protein
MVSLLLVDAILVVATVGSLRMAQRIWKSNFSWSDVTVDVSGRSNESRIRLYAASLSNAISISALAVAGILTAAAGAIGRTTVGRVVLAFGLLAGVSFIVFTFVTVSIYQRNRPRKLIPPSLRDR